MGGIQIYIRSAGSVSARLEADMGNVKKAELHTYICKNAVHVFLTKYVIIKVPV